ncbi:MAG: GNAT family N-acetyltransferase [Hyphomicrobiales bacterium]|nr:GNAT family N-acetyltransferase [Hyphomicrobiales bacterium]
MIDIAPLDKDDFDVWLPLWRGYQTFYKVDIPEATTQVTFQRLTRGQEPMGAFLAREDGVAVGMAHWIVHRSCWTVGDYCYLQDLFVAGARRGSGVGRKLIEAVYGLARGRGCSRVHWLTHETNAQAMLLYDRIATKSGFVQYVKKFE